MASLELVRKISKSRQKPSLRQKEEGSTPGLVYRKNHLDNKLRMTKEQALETGVNAVKCARQFTDDIEYFMEDSGRADRDYVYKVVEEVIKAGATTINVPDTTGYAYPDEYRDLMAGILNNVPNADKAILSCHCHNDLGMATANTVAGVMGGARQVEVTINGIGERAGNTALEEVVMALYVAPRRFGYCNQNRHDAAFGNLATGLAAHRHARPEKQGYCWRKCLRS